MILAISFDNFGPYHLARLDALGKALAGSGDRLVAYEMAGVEGTRPWRVDRGRESFEWVTFYPDRDVASLSASERRRAMRAALGRDRPDALAVPGYFHPECMTAVAWANRRGLPAVLMTDSQEIDYPRVWWKEAIKRRRVSRFDSALVAGTRSRDYMIRLGLRPDRVLTGYYAVDNAFYADRSEAARRAPGGRAGLPDGPYFLSVCRFATTKNLPRLVRAYARYREASGPAAWDLVLCGGGPQAAEIEAAIRSCGVSDHVHRPGFLQADGLARWYAFASAFVLASVVEQWGLVVNEAAACGLPLLVSERAGSAADLVAGPPNATGMTFDPFDEDAITAAMSWVAALPAAERSAMGRRAAEVVADWGPGRFVKGLFEAIRLASQDLAATPRRGWILPASRRPVR